MLPGYAVGNAKWLNPITILAVANSVVDPNATDAMSETAAKYLMDKFLRMGTKSGGWTLETAIHWSRSSTAKAHKVGPNRYFYAEICMILASTTKGEYNDDQITSTQLDSNANMVVVGQHSNIINWSGKSADVSPFSIDCSKLEAVLIVDAVVEYYFPHTLETFILVVRNGLYVH